MKKPHALLFVLFIWLFTNACFANEQQVYYGKWIIIKIITSGLVSSNSKIDEQKLLGKEIQYAEDLAGFGKTQKIHPFYKITTLSETDFQEEYSIDLERLVIKNNAVIQVEVYEDEKLDNLWDSVGSIILIKNKNTLILFTGGDFFELSRKNNE